MSSRRAAGRVVVIGAGPAGLAAAQHLVASGVDVLVCEAGPEVGGMARSFDRWGWRLDLGSHIFDDGHPVAGALWRDVIGSDCHRVPLRRAIQRSGRTFRYPLQPLEVVAAISPRGAMSALGRTLRPSLSTAAGPSAKDLVVARYGEELYATFFHSYMKKLWGVDGSEVDASFAADLLGAQEFPPDASPRASTMARLRPAPSKRGRRRTFSHPTAGIGALCDRLMQRVLASGGEVRTGTRVRQVCVEAGRICGVELDDEAVQCDGVVSSMPVNRLVGALPDVPKPVGDAAATLRARSTVLVYVRVQGGSPFPELWRYVYDDAHIGRVANVAAWWPATAQRQPPAGETVLCAELWCDAGDHIWKSTDDEASASVVRELAALGFAQSESIAETHVVRIPGTHPVPALGHGQLLAIIDRHLRTIVGLATTGRHGSHGSQDMAQSVAGGVLAAEALHEQIFAPTPVTQQRGQGTIP